MLPLLESQNLYQFPYEDEEVPDNEDDDDMKATSNLHVEEEHITWSVLFGLNSNTPKWDLECAQKTLRFDQQKNIQTCRRALR